MFYIFSICISSCTYDNDITAHNRNQNDLYTRMFYTPTHTRKVRSKGNDSYIIMYAHDEKMMDPGVLTELELRIPYPTILLIFI